MLLLLVVQLLLDDVLTQVEHHLRETTVTDASWEARKLRSPAPKPAERSVLFLQSVNSPYLLHGEHFFRGSGKLQQSLELDLRFDLETHRGQRSNLLTNQLATGSDAVNERLPHQFVVVVGVSVELRVRRHREDRFCTDR